MSGSTTQPEPSMARPQAVPSTRTTLREALRGNRRQRVQTRERVEDRAGWGQNLVEPAQDRRSLDVGPQLALSG
jgi:hypothetical protein